MKKLKYLGKVIFESESLDEVLDFKNKFFLEESNFKLSCLEKVNDLNKKKRTLPERNLFDTDEKYLKQITEENSRFIEEVENLGRDYFKDILEKTYFFDVPSGLFGFELKTKEKISMTELGILIRDNFPSDKDFEII